MKKIKLTAVVDGDVKVVTEKEIPQDSPLGKFLALNQGWPMFVVLPDHTTFEYEGGTDEEGIYFKCPSFFLE